MNTNSMDIYFYNTATRNTDKFESLVPGRAGMYACGPTVYNFAHIGNLRAYCVEDLLYRVLVYFGYAVVKVMNITDVDDKIIRSSNGEGKSLEEFTAPFIGAFKEDLNSLNIIPAERYPRATEHIPEIVTIIKSLVEKGFAYRSDDGSYYFSIEKFPAYGRLAKLNMGEMRSCGRIRHDEYDKESLSDFALWKAWDSDDGGVYWDTELGRGRPGWHIECSAMSMKYLGGHFDIHMGGVDNIFPHHENEIAQSEAYTGEKFVNYWIHGEHLLVDNKKMSKSLGNFYTLRDLTEKGYNPLALRYLYISTHYRSKLNFTLKGLDAASNTIEGLYDFMKRLKRTEKEGGVSDSVGRLVEETACGFDGKVARDLNMPQALSLVFSMISKINVLADRNELTGAEARLVEDFMLKIDGILGLELDGAREPELLPEDIEALIARRQEARQAKDFKTSDEIRDMLKEKGIILQDTPRGVVWKKI